MIDLEVKNFKEVKIDISGLFKKSENYREPKIVSLSTDFSKANKAVEEHESYLIPRIPQIDLVMKNHIPKEIGKDEPTMIHPNDPSLDKEEKKPVQTSGPILPLVQHNPIGSVQQSELYRQQQQMMYQAGQQYLANRGPINYQFHNPNGIPTLRQFQDDMNRKLNDPATVMESVIPKPPQRNTSGFVRINEVTPEEYKDTHYDREKEANKKLAESMKQSRDFGNPNRNIDPNIIPRRRLSYQEMISRKNNVNTPSVFDNYRMKSGDTILKVGGSTFTENETKTAFDKAKMEYEEQKRAILSRKPLVYNQAPKFYNPNDYTNYISNHYSERPKYYSGYGYMNVSGLPDENGLPTVWYNDNNKYLIPSKSEIDNGEVPIIHTNRDPITETKKETKVEENKWYINVSWVVTLEDGTRVRKHYNSKKDEITQSLYDENTDDIEDYSSMGKDAQDQFKGDDTLKLATELSRYNTEVADILAWSRNVIEIKDFINLKRACIDQLIKYRDNDPFSLIKSTVILMHDVVIVVKPKPTSLEEIEMIENGLIYKDHSSIKLDNIYKRYINQLKSSKTLKDKLSVLWNARDIEVIPRDEDDAYILAKRLIDGLKDPKMRSNFDRYRIWKNISRNKYFEEKRGDVFEKEFANWWNKPREFLSENQYEDKYNQRMAELTAQKLFKLNSSPNAVNTEFIKRQQQSAAEWEALSEGRFNKPNMTFRDYVIAMNVTQWNIEQAEIMKANYEKWKQTKTDTRLCKQSILDKVVDKNIERLGLSQVTKLPRYAPVSLSGIDKTLDVETRRQKFIERLLAKQRRPMI